MPFLLEPLQPLFLLLLDLPAETPAPTGGFQMFTPLIIVGFIFYFLLIRPESKKRKLHEQFLRNLAKGDKVMTNSGILGSVTGIQDDYVTLQIAQNVRVRFVRAAIQGFADPDEKREGGGESEAIPEEKAS